MTDSDVELPSEDDASSSGDSEPNTIPLKPESSDEISPAIRPYDAEIKSDSRAAATPTGEEYSLLNPPESWETSGPEPPG